LAGFFFDEAFEKVAHGHVEFVVGAVVPLFDPGQQLQQAGEERDEAFVVVAALLVADLDVPGTDGLSLLQMIVTGPRNH
jgi:CheY-like chemotaxis protein